MSYQAVQWALNANRTGPLAPETRLVLVVMAERADQKGRNVFHAEVTDVLDYDRLPGDPSARTAWVRCEASTALPYTVAVPLTGLRALAPNESRGAWRGHSRVHNPAPPTTKGTPA